MWTMGGGDVDDQDEWRRRMKPDNELPGCVALDLVLAETADAVISLAAVEVYGNGIDLRVDVRVRDRVMGPGFIGEQVLVGVEYADGRRAGTLPGRPGRGRPSPDDVRLMVGGGGGGLRSADLRMFLSPLPPPGPITIVCAWPNRDVPESSTTIDSAALRAAADRVRELWPCEPFTEQDAPEPPAAPPGGWFEETRRRQEAQ